MKVLIIGGVAAGMSAAARARRLDENAEIVVFERGKNVSFANCGLPYHIGGEIKEREALLLQTPRKLHALLNLDVRAEQEVVAIDRAAKTISVLDREGGRQYLESYDKLVLCPGAQPLRPPLPGIDHGRVLTLRNVEDMDAIKAVVDRSGSKRAVVIGAGFIGVEMAECLRARGMEVEMVEMVNQVLPPFDPEMARALEDHLKANDVKLHLGAAAAAFHPEPDGGVSVELKDGTRLAADLVVLSIGVKPDSALAKAAGLELGARGGIKVDAHLRTNDPDIFAAGDAIEVVDTATGLPAQIPMAGPANRQGRIVADNLFGKDSSYVSSQGTAIVKVFNMTAACTGASEKALERAKLPYLKVHLHPNDHAGYYPGATPIHLKLLFAPGDGKLLGAQAVGFEGVDKRIDVLATALRAGLTVRDLENLELAYAPPYGSAKDAVNMAGFVASNLLQGDLECWYPEDFPKETGKGLIVDVRPSEMYALWHIPGAVNVPIDKLRSSLDQLPKDKDLFLYCKVGFNSYLAYRALKQLGYGVARKLRSLSGGATTFRCHHGPEVCGAAAPGKPASPCAVPTAPTGPAVVLDACGVQCPGPIMKLKQAIDTMPDGAELSVLASDPGFTNDVKAWCDNNGHLLLGISGAPPKIEARIRKQTSALPSPQAAQAPVAASKDKTIIVFSGDLDKVMAAFVIANGALAMGSKVTLFFTFWGLNALRKDQPQPAGKKFMDMMFGWMMPKGVGKLTLSKMNMLGMGTMMMKQVMRDKKVEPLSGLLQSARDGGARLIACSMAMDVMGIGKDELIDGVEIAGVASFLEVADKGGATLFI